ncbi:MAG: Gfo/Idh/MocA family oxidoreductase [Pirellulales bacterium]
MAGGANRSDSQPQGWNRRRFLQTTVATGSAIAAGYFVNPLPAQQSNSPNERLSIAVVGVTGRAGENVRELSSQNIIAAADCDADLLERGTSRLQGTRKYSDFRVMLEKESEKIDAVAVSTADHTHAPASAMALRLKKHVYCEKPLTHTVFEARTLANLATENKLVTQMGTQIHAGDNYRRVVELIRAGAIGKVNEVHVWANARYSGAKFTTGKPAPMNLNWDLWLGPAPERPYSEGVHPFQWRRFWDYGMGALGDIGCHYIDLAHWALDLRHPTRVAAQGPTPDPVSAPDWCIVNYDYPSRGELPPVRLTWYDGGKRPDKLPEALAMLKDAKGVAPDWGSGQLFVGEQGILLADYGRHELLPREKFADYKRPEPSIAKSLGHHAEWVHAIKTGGSTTCNFDYSGALTEAVLLGTVAYRSGVTLDWDAKHLRVKNSDAAQMLIHKEYRKGWTL